MSTIAAVRRRLTQTFREAGLDTPALDARLLVGHALGLDHAALARAAERLLSLEEAERIEALGARRLRREPVARILGQKEFWGLSLTVTPAVLVPRADSETAVAAALAAIDSGGGRGRILRLADLGVGSGALLLALLSELPQAFGVGTDCDRAALLTARANAARLGLAARSGFVACHYGAALTGGFDLVIANPPYIRTGDIDALAPEVRIFDPRTALDGGDDGLDGYRAIAREARRLLAVGAVLVVEIGAGQSDTVAGLFAESGLAIDRRVLPDLAGIPRALVARR
ncbi:MAG: peptide chain release factor N(5)-glutamine methyltransferase [Xanthobacteraceae bacterium]